MRGAAIAIVLGVAASAHAEPALDDVLAQTQQPVMIVFGAAGCGPCKDMEPMIARSARALARYVELVHYDTVEPTGAQTARRFGVENVPAFVVIAHDGGVVARARGRLDAHDLLELARDGAARAARMTELASTLTRDPDDPAAGLELAEIERAAGRGVEAAVRYHDLLSSSRADATVRVRARIGLDRIETGWALTRGLADDELELEHHPGTSAATARLVRLAVAQKRSPARLHELAMLHLSHLVPATWDDLAAAIRAAVLAGAAKEADAILATWLPRIPPHHPAITIVAADLALNAGDVVTATRLVDFACRPTPAGYELPCYARRIAMASFGATAPDQGKSLSSFDHLRAITKASLEGTTPSLDPDYEALGDLDPAFGRAIAVAMLAASESCRPLVKADTILDVWLLTKGRRLGIGFLRDESSTPLAKCLDATIRLQPMPKLPAEITDLHLVSELRARPSPHIATTSDSTISGAVEPPSTPLGPELVAFAAIRTGAIETRGIGADGLIDLRRFDTARLVVEGQAELAAGDRDATFAARALVGIGYASRVFGDWSLATGIGASEYGEMAPMAVEVPIQARLGFGIRAARFSVWGQSAVIPKEPRRQEHRFGGDEIAVGITASLPSTHVFVGAMVESRVAGTTAVVLVGVPLVH